MLIYINTLCIEQLNVETYKTTCNNCGENVKEQFSTEYF